MSAFGQRPQRPALHLTRPRPSLLRRGERDDAVNRLVLAAASARRCGYRPPPHPSRRPIHHQQSRHALEASRPFAVTRDLPYGGACAATTPVEHGRSPPADLSSASGCSAVGLRDVFRTSTDQTLRRSAEHGAQFFRETNRAVDGEERERDRSGRCSSPRAGPYASFEQREQCLPKPNVGAGPRPHRLAGLLVKGMIRSLLLRSLTRLTRLMQGHLGLQFGNTGRNARLACFGETFGEFLEWEMSGHCFQSCART